MAWATTADATRHWQDSSGLDTATVEDLLEAAYQELLAYAPIRVDARTLYDVVTSDGSTEVTSKSAFFGTSDVGRAVTGTGIPADTTIVRVKDSCTVVLSAAATASGSDVEVTVGEIVPPSNYVLANVYQAREIYTAQQRGDTSADVVGFGDFAIRARPLSAVVRQLLRPQGHSLLGFA